MRRLSLRTQLMLLYAVPFFFSGAALLSIPILSTSQTEPAGGQGVPSGGPAPEPDQALLTSSAVGLALMVVVSFLLGWFIAGRFLRPLRTVTATANDISANNLHQRLPVQGNNEFAELSSTLNDLFERLERSFESQRRFVANASHELRTPLTAERALLQVALADPNASAASLREACHELIGLSEAQERLIDSLLTLASGEQGIEQREPIDLGDIATAVVAARDGEAKRRGVTIETSLRPAPTSGDPRLAESLIANLVDNAIRHNVAGGTVSVSTTSMPGIRVVNSGKVIAPDQVEQLFQPFQRLGAQRVHHHDGHGLGLAIVQAIATAHGAVITANARPEGGLDIEVSFPRR